MRSPDILPSRIIHQAAVSSMAADEYPTDALVRKGTSSYNDSGLPDVDVITNLEEELSPGCVNCSQPYIFPPPKVNMGLSHELEKKQPLNASYRGRTSLHQTSNSNRPSGGQVCSNRRQRS